MRGIRRTIGTAPANKATADLITAILDTCRTDLRGLRDHALIAFGFALAMRWWRFGRLLGCRKAADWQERGGVSMTP